MTNISADMVRELRERTGCGMMDCKRALTAADGNLEAALDNLRKSGLAKAAKKAERATTEGKVVVGTRPGVAAMVEVLCETDFVARNEKFGRLCESALAILLDQCPEFGDLTDVMQPKVANQMIDLVNNVGENLKLRRAARWQTTGTVGTYLHLNGKIGVFVEVEGSADEDYLKKLAMQVAAENPVYIRPEDVPAAMVAKEREIAAAQPDVAGKPANIAEKIIDGKLRKYYEQVCLLEQNWLFDEKGKTKVGKVNPQVRILRFMRWKTGQEL